MTLKEHTLKTLAVIQQAPDKYKDVLELPVHVRSLPEVYFMSYMGMIIQAILIVNQASYELTKKNYQAYNSCVKVFRDHDIAYNRVMSASVKVQFDKYLDLQIPTECIKPFIKEYQLKLYGNYLYMDSDTKEYITDFNDDRLLEKARLVWSIQYTPLLTYEYREEILEILGITA